MSIQNYNYLYIVYEFVNFYWKIIIFIKAKHSFDYLKKSNANIISPYFISVLSIRMYGWNRLFV